MKNFKMILWTMTFSMISSGMIAMETYKSKVYIRNNNTPSRIGASIGIKAIINGDMDNAPFVPEGQEKVIGQLGNIKALELVPSSGGTGKLSGVGKVSTYPLTEKLQTLSRHPNEDMVIVVDNNSYSGYWNINFSWRKQLTAESGATGKADLMSDRLQNQLKHFNMTSMDRVMKMWANDKTPTKFFRKKLEEYARAYESKEFNDETYGSNLEYLWDKFSKS